MGTLTLSDTVEVERLRPTLDEAEADVFPVLPSTAVGLRKLNAPEDLVRAAAVAAAFPETGEASRTRERVAEFLRRDEGDFVPAGRVYHRLQVLACSAPGAGDAKVTATLALATTVEGGLELTLGGFGLKSGAKYTLTQDLELECASGETKLGYILIPFERETRWWRPPGAGESFEVERLVPVRDVSQFGSLATTGSVDELVGRAIGEAVPLGGGDAAYSDSRSKQLDVSLSVELGFGDEKAAKLGITASLTGSVQVKTDFELPVGSFHLRWLKGPPGALVTT
jgi:hypothetical protein